MQLAASTAPPCKSLHITPYHSTPCHQPASRASTQPPAHSAKLLLAPRVPSRNLSWYPTSGRRSALPSCHISSVSCAAITYHRHPGLVRRVTVHSSNGSTTGLLQPSGSDQLSANNPNASSSNTSDAIGYMAAGQPSASSESSPGPSSGSSVITTSTRAFSDISSVADMACSSSSCDGDDTKSSSSSGSIQQPLVQYSTSFGGGPSVSSPAVPPAGLNSISSCDEEDSTLHPQATEQEQALAFDSTGISNTTVSQSTLSSDIVGYASTVVQETKATELWQQQEGEQLSVQPSSSSSKDIVDSALMMSFMEEDTSTLATMYDVISRASVVLHEQTQQQKQTESEQSTIQQEQKQEELQQLAGISQTSSLNIDSSSSSSLSSQDIAAIAELQTATEKKLVELQHAVEELQLGEEATQQLTDVLHKLEQLEQDLSAVVQYSSSSNSLAIADTGVVDTQVALTAAAAAAPVEVLPPLTVLADVAVQKPTAPLPPAETTAEPEIMSSTTQDGGVTATTAVQTSHAAVVAASSSTPAAAAAAAAAAPGALAVAHTLEMEAFAASAVIGGAASPAPELLAPTSAPPAAAAAAAITPAAAPRAADSTVLWPLFVLGLSYVHQATSGFALPALLPMVSPDLNLTDFQGALLTSGYSYLYALALVPVGLLADKLDRPKLLAVGLALWSTLSIVSSGAKSFGELLIARTGFAIAQAAQNPVSFSLIPDLFPANKSTALAAYNCAIYLGRALSFASLLAAHRVSAASRIPGGKLPAVGTMADAAAGNASDEGVALSMVPLDALDLQRMSIIYTSGDMAAVTPLYNYNFHVIAYEAVAGGSEGWRQLLTWIGYPGFAIALLMWLSVREPRHQDQQQQQQQQQGVTSAMGDNAQGSALSNTSAVWKEGAARFTTQMFNLTTGHGWHGSNSSNSSSNGSSNHSPQQQPELAGPACVIDTHLQPSDNPANSSFAIAPPAAVPTGSVLQETPVQSSALAVSSSDNPILSLLKIKPFQATTIAAALNDVGSYSLIAWHSTFYERVFGLDSGVYAPMLAVILPVGGILGGVGGGLIADWLSVVGGRYWLTAGASLLAAPFVAQSLLAHTPAGSFTALLAGFALSEAWRAPGAIMIRSVAPQELGSTASALYLCIRNLIGGFGPVAVAKLAELVGLQHAMLLAPACYVVSGLIFYIAEKEIEDLQKQQQMLLPQGKQ